MHVNALLAALLTTNTLSGPYTASRTGVCMCVHVCVCVYILVCIYIYIYMYTHVHVYMHVHVYIHVYIMYVSLRVASKGLYTFLDFHMPLVIQCTVVPFALLNGGYVFSPYPILW